MKIVQPHDRDMQELRIFREAWRVSRATFFDLEHARHEALRRQVDEIYYSSLALLLKLMVELDDDDQITAQVLDSLGVAHTDERAASFNENIQDVETAGAGDPVTRTRLLTERIPAYLIARTESAADDAVCARLGKRASTPQARPIVRLARLGRCVPENGSALWLHWLNLWLYPAVYPSGRDPYTVNAMLREFAVFCADPLFWRLLARPTTSEAEFLALPHVQEFFAGARELVDDDAESAYLSEHADLLQVHIQPALESVFARRVTAESVAKARRTASADVAWCVPGFYQKVTLALSAQDIADIHGGSADTGNLLPLLDQIVQLQQDAAVEARP